MDERSIFLQALEQPAGERLAWLQGVCESDTQMRERIEALLARHELANSFLEQPAPQLDATVVQDLEGLLQAGLAPAFGQDKAVVVGSAGHSVLRMLANTIDVPHVSLRESEAEGAEPITRPSSPEVPKCDSDQRYRLDGEIARGGMGAIIKGRDTDLGRDLAIKVLLDSHKDKTEVIQRFIEEAQIGGQLQHPGIVPIYELGQFADKRPFFAMKLVKGQTLSKLLANREDAADERGRFIGIFEQVCQTMAYAHSRGVIHRDLKPANIMVGAFGEVQVMDWGLAKVLSTGGVADEKSAKNKGQGQSIIQTLRSGVGSQTPVGFGSTGSETKMGSVMGTPAYMPPEQALGEIDQLDQRADVFGLGAILCEILSGQPPYVGSDGMAVFRLASRGKLDDCLARLKACAADGELIQLATQCLALEPDDRPKDAGELAKRISGYLESVESKLRETEMERAAQAARVIEERKRRWVQLALAATVMFALMLGGGGWLWIKADRDARHDQVMRDVNEALNQATALRAKAQASTTQGEALMAQAREQVQRALALVENGPADPAMTVRVRQLEAVLDDEEKDRTLLAALDEASLAQAATVAEKNTFHREGALPFFREAFRAYGLPAGEVEVKVAAERIRQSSPAVRDAILEALDEWGDLADNIEPHRKWVRAVQEACETKDAWSRASREAFQVSDPASRDAALKALAKSADVTRTPARALTRLVRRIPFSQEAERLMRRAQRQYPADFWVNHNLGTELHYATTPDYDEAVRFLTVAVALRPASSGAHLNLGTSLDAAGRPDEAITCFQKAIELDPTYVEARESLAACFFKNGNYRKAIETDPNYADAHGALGQALANTGDLDGAIDSYRKAIELDPKNASHHINMGTLLCDVKREYDAAIVCFQKAIQLAPESAKAHYNLGNAVGQKGDRDKAVACYRKAIELDPEYAEAHCNYGYVLKRQGRFAESLAAFRQGHELGKKQPDWRYPSSADWVRQAEVEAALEARLYQILKGESSPRDNPERLALLGICHAKKLYRAATDLSTTALAADPKLADDLSAGHRYNAACCAALAAAGKGEDGAKLDDAEKAELRVQALEWLRADLALWDRQLENGMPADHATVQSTMLHWQQDPDLDAIRDNAALAKLPAEERQEFTQLWAVVVALLEKAKK